MKTLLLWAVTAWLVLCSWLGVLALAAEAPEMMLMPPIFGACFIGFVSIADSRPAWIGWASEALLVVLVLIYYVIAAWL